MGFYREREIAESLAQACRVLAGFNMTDGAHGHVSYRMEDDTMLIKGKGPGQVGLRHTAARDIVKVNWDADMVDGPDDLQPPSESFLHIWIYKARPDVMSVVHVHPKHAVLLTITGKPIVSAYGPYRPGADLARDGVPIYPDARTIGTPEQGEAFAETMGNHNVALMTGHGIASAGDCIERSTMNALALEILCETMVDAYRIGTPQPLPASTWGNRTEQPTETGRRRRGSAGGTEGMLASWRDYVAEAEDRLGSRI